jgi:hypothetical protein
MCSTAHLRVVAKEQGVRHPADLELHVGVCGIAICTNAAAGNSISTSNARSHAPHTQEHHRMCQHIQHKLLITDVTELAPKLSCSFASTLVGQQQESSCCSSLHFKCI